MVSGTERCVEFLKAEGFRPSVDENGEVCFRFEGGHYVAQFQPDDPEYARLLYPYFWPLRNDDEVRRAFAAANEVTKLTKAAKVFVVADRGRGDVCASIESFVQCPEQFEAGLGRSLRTLQIATRRFGEQMRAPSLAGALAAWPGGEGLAPN
jgi:hypothetical protein